MSLDRFLGAQALMYDQAFGELVAGKKQGHWMWFVFPQLRGLGSSSMAQLFGLEAGEALEYLKHPVLRPRLLECVLVLETLNCDRLLALLGGIDFVKLRSSLTLFEWAALTAWNANPFESVLDGIGQEPSDAIAGRSRCPTTLRRLASE
jgi:uncharacterized protein (DUF1810 family)